MILPKHDRNGTPLKVGDFVYYKIYTNTIVGKVSEAPNKGESITVEWGYGDIKQEWLGHITKIEPEELI